MRVVAFGSRAGNSATSLSIVWRGQFSSDLSPGVDKPDGLSTAADAEGAFLWLPYFWP